MDPQESLNCQAVAEKVQSFYAVLPFNSHESAAQAAQAVREGNSILAYPNFDELLHRADSRAEILDAGCGAGWFSNSAAYHYGLRCQGIDLCQPALERAVQVGRELGISEMARFKSLDLFSVDQLGRQFDFVNSIGVLHHTFDCRLALVSVARAVRPGGFLHIGLYHRYGREPFLQLFQPYRDRLAASPAPEEGKRIEEEALGLYKELNRQITDPVFLRSWFRDQVLHPHESQHTAEEVHSWLSELGFDCLSTSINCFEKVADWRKVFEQERELAAVSIQRNRVEKRYFPGFFTLLARRKR